MGVYSKKICHVLIVFTIRVQSHEAKNSCLKSQFDRRKEAIPILSYYVSRELTLIKNVNESVSPCNIVYLWSNRKFITYSLKF